MRAYLPISHDELAAFLNSGSKELESILAPTPFYVGENEDLGEEEIEYLFVHRIKPQELFLPLN